MHHKGTDAILNGDLTVLLVSYEKQRLPRLATLGLLLCALGPAGSLAQVKAPQKISFSGGIFIDRLDDLDAFGSSVVNLGDLDGDGVADLAVGTPLDDDGGTTLTANQGAVWILFLREDGTVKSHQKISDTEGSFTGALENNDHFGASVATLGDLDGDGVPDLAVGAPLDDDGGATLTANRGAVWILFLRPDGTVQPHQKISNTDGGFTTTLDDFDAFGTSVASLGDLDGDGVADLAVGAPFDDDGGRDAGAVWILFLHPDGTVKIHQKISQTEGFFTGALDDNDHFGASVATLGDLDGDPETVTAIAVGAPLDDDGGRDAGAVWILFLRRDGTVKKHQKISNTEGGFTGTLDDFDTVGASVATLGDLDGDPETVTAIAVGAPLDDDGGRDAGAVWILFLHPNGTVKRHQKLSRTEGDFAGELAIEDRFGHSVAGLGDLDGDGVADLAVGAPFDDDGGVVLTTNRGAVWVLSLRSDGTVKIHQKISDTEGFFTGALVNDNRFGASVATLGDLDRDGVVDLAVGSSLGFDRLGAVWILFLHPDGTVRAHQQHSRTQGDFVGVLGDDVSFGTSVASLRDLDGDEVADLAIGAPRDRDGGTGRGAVWISFNALLPPPLIQDLDVTPSRPTPGEQLQISARIIAMSGITDAAISFRTGGDPEFLTAPMSAQGADRYEFTIPSFAVSHRGIEYFITATNLNGLQTRVPSSGIVSIPVFVPEGLNGSLAHGSEAAAYRLFSVPLDLDEKSARAVLEDDLGAYNKKGWRFFGYTEGGQRAELDTEDMDMTPGRAFWMLVKDSGQGLNTGSGTSVPTAMPYHIRLHPGWNYVGNPFNFSIPLANVYTASGQPLDIRTYEGFWSTPEGSLEPFEGYAAFNDQSTIDTLRIDPDVSNAVSAATKQATARRAEGAAWSICVLARQGQARDTDNVAAVAPGAAQTWDPLDRPEPPVIGDYVSVYFPHPEWSRNTARYSTDTRPLPADGETWTFEVITRTPAPVTLHVEGLETVPPDFDIRLVDDALQTWQDLRQMNRYVVAGAGEGIPKRLKLVVGTPAFLDDALEMVQDIPVRYELFQNYPNPFNPVTTIRYGLPAPETVTLVVYNMLGAQVATLIREAKQEAGYHVVVWDGRNGAGMAVASGVYFLRMRAGAFIATRTLTLIK